MKIIKCKRCGNEFKTGMGSTSRKLCFHCDNDFYRWKWANWNKPELKQLFYLTDTRQINYWVEHEYSPNLPPRRLTSDESSYKIILKDAVKVEGA